MFHNCTSLVEAPELPATTLADGCYEYMFEGCTSLVKAPELPATTLIRYCYYRMFYGCTSLVEAPELPATELVYRCYYYMFYNCSKLSYVKADFTELSTDNTYRWLYGVASTGTFVKDPDATWNVRGEHGIPNGWGIIYDTPLYIEAIEDLTVSFTVNSIQYSLDRKTWSTLSTGTMVSVESGNKIYFKASGLTPTSEKGIGTFNISGGTCNVGGNIMSMLYDSDYFKHTSLTQDYTFVKLFYQQTNIVNAGDIQLQTLNLTIGCYSNMFNGCTNLITAPVLLALELVDNCYEYMFYNCNKLSYLNANFITTPSESYTQQWLYGVASTGTFAKNPDATWDVRGEHGIPEGWTIIYDTPLYIEAIEDLTVSFTVNSIQYSLDRKTWSTLSTGTMVSVESGNKIYFKASGLTPTSEKGIGTFNISGGTCNVGGDIMSMLYGDYYNNGNYILQDFSFIQLFAETTIIDASQLKLSTTKLAPYCYYGMFYNCRSLVNAPKLSATELADNCYSLMFYGCTSLVNAPELPATTLAKSCYAYMFGGCTSLVNAPKLPATELANSCYGMMFGGCTSLVNAPELPATELAEGCYVYMFATCTGLVESPKLPATTLAKECYAFMFNGTNVLPDISCIDFNSHETISSGGLAGLYAGTRITYDDLLNILPINDNGRCYLPVTTLNSYCYEYMFYNCKNLTKAPELPATELADHCYYSMFQGCISLVEAPKLPATTLLQYCYYYMFEGCTSLVNAPELSALELNERSCEYMFRNCTSLVNAPELPATELASNCYNSMFYGCTSLVNVPSILPATELANNCYYNMFYGCTSLVNAPELPATELAEYCYYGMFRNCTSLVEAPELPATELAYYCYGYMFYDCTNLSYIKAMFLTTPSYSYTGYWTSNVSSTGTFVKNPDATWDNRGIYAIPEGWSIN